MVKASERVRDYRPRAPHKEGCMCSVCKAKRARLEALIEPEIAVTPSPPLPTKVRIDSLPTVALFELNGQRYRVGEKTPECVVCYRLKFISNGPQDSMWQVIGRISLAIYTMVEPI